MSALRTALADYLTLRRGLGFKLKEDGSRLRLFVSFMESRKAARITTKLALQFATQNPQLTPKAMSLRLSAVRGFARYQAGNDPATEVPMPGLLSHRSHPARPFLYSEAEIAGLLRAARNPPSWNRFSGPWWHRWQGWSWYCFIALLVVSGMRVGEVLNLRDEDVDWNQGLLTLHKTKFGKSRLIPLHRTMTRALHSFVQHRDRFFAKVRPRILAQRLFVTSCGTPIHIAQVNTTFLRISRQIGLRGLKDRRGPRLHDLRHRFAVETLIHWYRSGEEVDRLLPVLSTYLGHTNVSGTFWYLRCTPELMAAAGDRLEQRWKGVR